MKYTLIATLCVALASGCALLDPAPGPEPQTNGGAAPSGGGAPGGWDDPGGGAAPGGWDDPGAGGGSSGQDPLVAEGEAIYMQSCAVCHGADGSGTGLYEDSIQGATGMTGVVRQGRGTMPGFPQMTDRDIQAMEAYLASFLNGGGASPGGAGGGAAPPRAPSTPREHYTAACSACHGATGEGNAQGPQLRNPVVPYATWVTRHGRSGVGYPTQMPAYDTDALPAATLDGIFDWLSAAPVPQDGRGLYNRFCANCHGADGRGGPTRAGILGEDLGEWIETVRDGEGGRDYGDRGEYMPSWSRLELSDAQIRLMYDALRNGGGVTRPPATPPPGEGDDDDDDDD